MFRLIKVAFKDHRLLGNVTLQLSEKDTAASEVPYKSILIGMNGVGKSYALRSISDIFTKFELYKRNTSKYPFLDFSFHIRYAINSTTYDIYTLPMTNLTGQRRKSKKYMYLKNCFEGSVNLFVLAGGDIQDTAIDLDELVLPKKVLVLSPLFNDRFQFFKSNSDDFYQYLGSRATAGSATTKTTLKKFVRFLSEALEKEQFKDGLSKILEVLGYDTYIIVSYDTKYTKNFYNGQQDLKSFQEFFENWEQTTDRNTPPWGTSHFKHLKEHNMVWLLEVIGFLNNLVKNKLLESQDGKETKRLNLDLFKEKMVLPRTLWFEV